MENEVTGQGSHAHKTLVAQAVADRKCLQRMLEEGSRDFEVMKEFLERYASHLLAADRVSNQSGPV